MEERPRDSGLLGEFRDRDVSVESQRFDLATEGLQSTAPPHDLQKSLDGWRSLEDADRLRLGDGLLLVSVVDHSRSLHSAWDRPSDLIDPPGCGVTPHDARSIGNGDGVVEQQLPRRRCAAC